MSIKGIAVIGFLLSCLAEPGRAQTSKNQEAVIVPMVKVYVTVRGDKDAPITDLRRDDFTVLEDGTKQEISYFSQEALPLKIGLVIDCSLSMADNMEAARQAAIQLVQKLNPDDQALVIGFSNSVTTATDLTTDHKLLEKTIHGLNATGGTALYDALHVAVLALRGQEGKRAIVLLSDGKDEIWGGGRPGSRRTFEEVSEELARSRIALYPNCFGESSFLVEWDLDKKYTLKEILESMAFKSGGRCVMTQRATALSGSFMAILTELRTQYNLFYMPTNRIADNTWREIMVILNRPVREIVHRQGYYATQ